ncbi:hypothetical protein E8D34_06895 [Nocardioides sp. GY 10113]|uniref:hypothetical protein n=1 Tax=Nocardioides sp. GY 10113 TaxID=2569761 RepID=UPI0010A8E80A|nr:hypothetical protein [Nocardioides sp. GY 10113]TIC88009.1 hypothetical protein E8D34_06895 [Nocardioides sp. GY 10113]
MYDMYPDWSGTEWGPAKHDPQHPFRHDHTDGPAGRDALQAAFGGGAALALRDGDALRPDDN